MELNDVPLLTVDPADGQSAPVFKCLHSVWYDEDKEQEKSDIEQDDENEILRASSLKSTLSQQPDLEFSQPLSQILEQSQPLSQNLEPQQQRQKVSRKEAMELLRQASCSTEAAQKALEKITGEEFVDASGEELLARDALIDKIRKRLNHLQQETRRKNRRVPRPDETFLSTSGCEEVVMLKKSKDDGGTEKVLSSMEEKATKSQEKSEAEGGANPSSRPYKKPFDQLKATGVYQYYLVARINPGSPGYPGICGKLPG